MKKSKDIGSSNDRNNREPKCCPVRKILGLRFKNQFDYGESVKIAEKAPEKYHPSETGFICGMIDIDSKEAAIAYDCIDSDWLYTVELLNGSSLQIPEKFLEKDSSS